MRETATRDPNPRDQGDWSESECFGAYYDSFFHGLFVAGLIGANSNNGIGIAGIAPNVKILPVRTLGVCGGTFEDIVAGMLWASGVPIAGVPPNLTPAKVINLSLGGPGPSPALRDAISYAVSRGAFVAIAAGNSGDEGNPEEFPAAYAEEIRGAMAVGAVNRSLTRSG